MLVFLLGVNLVYLTTTCAQSPSNFTILYDGYFADQMWSSKSQAETSYVPIRTDTSLQSVVAMDKRPNNKDSGVFTFGKDLSVFNGQQITNPRTIDFKDSLDSLVRRLFFLKKMLVFAF